MNVYNQQYQIEHVHKASKATILTYNIYNTRLQASKDNKTVSWLGQGSDLPIGYVYRKWTPRSRAGYSNERQIRIGIRIPHITPYRIITLT